MTAIPISLGRAPQIASESVALPDPGVGLVDTHGRVHRDLRISLTDRCSLRCTYCMPEQGNEWLARTSILTTEEIVEIAEVAASLGIRTFRLTGGEPLLRTDIVDVVRRVAAISGPDGPVEVAMTMTFSPMARPMAARKSCPEIDAGVRPSRARRAARDDSLRSATRMLRSVPVNPAAFNARCRSARLSSVRHSGKPPHPSSSFDGRYGTSSESGQTFDGFSVRPPHEA